MRFSVPQNVAAITKAASETGASLPLAFAVATQETGLNPAAGPTPDPAGGYDVGLFQRHFTNFEAAAQYAATYDPLTQSRQALADLARAQRSYSDPGVAAVHAQGAVEDLSQYTGVPGETYSGDVDRRIRQFLQAGPKHLGAALQAMGADISPFALPGPFVNPPRAGAPLSLEALQAEQSSIASQAAAETSAGKQAEALPHSFSALLRLALTRIVKFVGGAILIFMGLKMVGAGAMRTARAA